MSVGDPTYNKSLLSSQQTKIGAVFEKYKNKNNYFAVYFSTDNKPYLTFGSLNNFPSIIKISKTLYTLCFSYDTSKDFTTQTNQFLA